jgi:hypothetical protein
MSVAETLRGHAWAALRMAEAASDEDRRCLVALAQTWFRQAEQAAKEHQPPSVRLSGERPHYDKRSA